MTETEAIEALLEQTGIFIWCAASVEPPFAGVREIDLGGTEISDEGLEYLKYFPRLEWLCLEETAISDNGLQHLAAITGLKKLELKGTSVTSHGVAMLRRAMPTCDIEC